MKIEQTIKKILREEIKKVDLSPLLEKILNRELVKYNTDSLCGIKVVHPDKRESESKFEFTRYGVTLIFIGDEKKLSFDAREKYVSLMDEAWNIIYDTISTPVDLYSKIVKTCDE